MALAVTKVATTPAVAIAVTEVATTSAVARLLRLEVSGLRYQVLPAAFVLAGALEDLDVLREVVERAAADPPSAAKVFKVTLASLLHVSVVDLVETVGR